MLSFCHSPQNLRLFQELVNFGNSVKHNPTVKASFFRHKRSLEEIFCYFANVDDVFSSTKGASHKPKTVASLLESGLSINEFMGMLKSVNLFNPTVPMQVTWCQFAFFDSIVSLLLQAVGSIMEAIQSLSESGLHRQGMLQFWAFRWLCCRSRRRGWGIELQSICWGFFSKCVQCFAHTHHLPLRLSAIFIPHNLGSFIFQIPWSVIQFVFCFICTI